MLYCYFGHHKAATTFIGQEVVPRVCGTIGLRRCLVNSPADFEYNLGDYIQNHNIEFLSYVNASDKFVKQVQQPFKGFHVIRDPRDIIVSAYFSHRNSHSSDGWPELVSHRAKLQSESQEDGLLREIDFSLDLMTDGIALHPLTSIANWNYRRKNILELRYEEMVGRTPEFFLDVFNFLGLVSSSYQELGVKIINRLLPAQYRRYPCIGQATMSKILKHTSFSSLTGGRQIGKEDCQSHYRKGQPGEWKTQFSDKVKARFKSSYPDLLSKLNYEPNDDW